MKHRYEIRIYFLPSPNGKLFDLKEMTLTTKPTTWKRAQEIAEEEAAKCWEFTDIEIQRLK